MSKWFCKFSLGEECWAAFCVAETREDAGIKFRSKYSIPEEFANHCNIMDISNMDWIE